MGLRFIRKGETWDEVVGHFNRRDFFHSYAYHRGRAACMGAEPILIVLRDGGHPVFSMPMLRREISPDCFDLVSVYGYPGPLCDDNDLLPSSLVELESELHHFGCVSLFCRLHPMINECLPDLPCIHDCGRTVLLECLPEDERLKRYRQTTRNEIRRLAKVAEVRFGTDAESFDAFLGIYYQTMRDLGADDFYFFSREFLQSIFEINGTVATVGTVRLDDEVISGALFTACNGIGQYFLGGAKREYSKLAPQKLLLHRACDWAIENGVDGLHLGGGRGSREDGLFKFKAGFSKTFLPFRVIKMITNRSKYDTLTSVPTRGLSG